MINDLNLKAATAPTTAEFEQIQQKATALLEKVKESPEYKQLSKTTINQAYDILGAIVKGEEVFPKESDEGTYQNLKWKAQLGTLSNEELLTAVQHRQLSKNDYRNIVTLYNSVQADANKPDDFQVKQINNTRKSVIALFARDPLTGVLDPSIETRIQLQHDSLYSEWYTKKLANGEPISYNAYLNDVVDPLLKTNGKSLQDLLQLPTEQDTGTKAKSSLTQEAFNAILNKTTEELTKNKKLFGFIPTWMKKKPEAQEVEAATTEAITTSLTEISNIVSKVPELSGNLEQDLNTLGYSSIQQVASKYGLNAADPREQSIALRRANLEAHGADFNGIKKTLLNSGLTEEYANSYMVLYGTYLGTYIKNYILQQKPLANAVDIFTAVEDTLKSMGYPQPFINNIIPDVFGSSPDFIDTLINNKFQIEGK